MAFERYTKVHANGDVSIRQDIKIAGTAAFERLAAYEDLGLPPEELKEMIATQ